MEKNEKNKAASFSEHLKSFSEETTTHGPRNISQAVRFWGKLVWFILFLGLCGVFIWQAISLVVEYYQYPSKIITDIIIIIHQ